jgi:hypothetical protein
MRSLKVLGGHEGMRRRADGSGMGLAFWLKIGIPINHICRQYFGGMGTANEHFLIPEIPKFVLV